MLPYETTHHVRDHCLCLHAQRTARALARRFDEALRPLGLTSGQFSLLNALNRPRPASMNAVATLLGMDRTTLTAALKPLQRRGWAEVVVDGEDRRSRLLRLTRAGRLLLTRAFPVWRHTHKIVDRLVEPAEGDLRRGLAALAGRPAAA